MKKKILWISNQIQKKRDNKKSNTLLRISDFSWIYLRFRNDIIFRIFYVYKVNEDVY